MSNWYNFDGDTVEERTRAEAVAEIEAAERAALDACRKISDAAHQRWALVGHAAQAALIHIAHQAAYHAKKAGE